MRNLINLPKAHLHLHLEGAIRPKTLAQIATQHRLTLPSCVSNGHRFRDFADFNRHYRAVCGCLRSANDFRRIAFECCEDEASQGVRYAEVTFTLGAYGVRLGEWEMPLEAVLEGFAAGEKAYGIKCRVVVDHGRRSPPELAWRALATALKYKNSGVVAFGLGGDEIYPPEPFSGVFSAAVDGGLHSVPHAGETTGPESIRGALTALRAQRIGHGITALADRSLVEELKSRAVALEVCLTSNVAISGLVSSIVQHPFPQLIAAGLTVTINSDSPALFASPLANEYQLARDVFGLSDHELASLAKASVAASFADELTKASIGNEIEQWEREGA